MATRTFFLLGAQESNHQFSIGPSNRSLIESAHQVNLTFPRLEFGNQRRSAVFDGIWARLLRWKAR
jgi:hypothetical protein